MEIPLLRRTFNKVRRFALDQQIDVLDPGLSRLNLKIDKSSFFCL